MLYKQKYKILSVILAAGVLLILYSFKGSSQEQQQYQAVNVDFFEVNLSSVSVETNYPGAIEGTVNVDIKAQVTGYLEKIFVKEGDYVSKGQSLFKIKGESLNEQINLSRASLKAALAAEESAKIELEKIRPLVKEKVVSELQLKSAEANYAAAKAQVSQAKSSLSSAQINAAFGLIKAPISGYIGRIPNRIGNLITPGDAVPLTSLADINNVFVYFSMSEADFMAYMKDGAAANGMKTAELITADGKVYNHKGRLEAASGNIDRATGSIAMKAVFPNPEKILRSGGSARLVIKKNLNSVLTVPMICVKDIQDKYFVFALAGNNKVTMKTIEVAGSSGNSYIIKSGLCAGEKVAQNQLNVLADGMTVSYSAAGGK